MTFIIPCFVRYENKTWYGKPPFCDVLRINEFFKNIFFLPQIWYLTA